MNNGNESNANGGGNEQQTSPIAASPAEGNYRERLLDLQIAGLDEQARKEGRRGCFD